jgi:hypothetical protein
MTVSREKAELFSVRGPGLFRVLVAWQLLSRFQERLTFGLLLLLVLVGYLNACYTECRR